VRRGAGSTVRLRRALVVLDSAGGNTVPVIARLVQADEDSVPCVIHRLTRWHAQPRPSPGARCRRRSRSRRRHGRGARVQISPPAHDQARQVAHLVPARARPLALRVERDRMTAVFANIESYRDAVHAVVDAFLRTAITVVQSLPRVGLLTRVESVANWTARDSGRQRSTCYRSP
jgi:hypothetical protein